MKLLSLFVTGLILHCGAIAQTKPKRLLPTDSTVLGVDTIVSKSSEYFLMHYHQISRLVQNKVLFDKDDSVFNGRFNSFSRLVFRNRFHSFDVPTVPLTHVIYLEHFDLILGFSKFSFSPYQMVLYKSDGKLVHKMALHPFELKVSKSELRQLLKEKPELNFCLSQMVVVKENDHYYLELSPCVFRTLGRDSIVKMKSLRLTHYFPNMTSPAMEDFGYDEYYGFISSSDPLYELVMIGSVPYLLILQTEKGMKVNIPLASNCEVLKDLQE